MSSYSCALNLQQQKPRCLLFSFWHRLSSSFACSRLKSVMDLMETELEYLSWPKIAYFSPVCLLQRSKQLRTYGCKCATRCSMPERTFRRALSDEEAGTPLNAAPLNTLSSKETSYDLSSTLPKRSDLDKLIALTSCLLSDDLLVYYYYELPIEL